MALRIEQQAESEFHVVSNGETLAIAQTAEDAVALRNAFVREGVA
jgi:hypothetical protein